MSKNRIVGILGLGIFGTALAKRLYIEGIEVIACDRDEKIVNALDPYLAVGAVGDFTDMNYLKSIGIADCSTVVIAAGTSLEATVLGVVGCKELGVERVICKAKDRTTIKVLDALGVNQTIIPEEEAGAHLANRLTHNNVEDLIQLDDMTSVVQFHVPQKWLNQTIQELNIRNQYNMNIIGIYHDDNELLDTQFSPDYVLAAADVIVAVADTKTFDEIDYLEYM